MKKLCSVLLLGVGLLNVYPLIGVVSVEQLARLYGLGIESPDLVILMRHRAVLFGLLGGFLILAVFRPALRITASVAGLVSMSSFILLAIFSDDTGPAINKIVTADLIGCVAISVVLIVSVKDRRGAV